MVSTIYTYPSASELKTIEPEKIATLTLGDPLFEVFPIVNMDSHVLSWEQRDNFTGLQAVRGINGQPSRVRPIGGRRFTMEPGVYGEFKPIDEQEMTVRRQYGTEATVVNITDLVTEAQDFLLSRRVDRIRQVGWTLLSRGVFSIATEAGSIMHADAYPIQRLVAAVPWTNFAASTPLANFRAMKLLGRGRSTSFGAQARAYMNQVTFNNMLSSTNVSDIAGRRTIGLNALVALNRDEVNRVLLGEDLPQVVVYDDGFIDDAGVFQLYIPDGTVVVIGTRPAGQPVGEYVMTRNVNNPGGAPGAYVKIVDKADEVPREIKVHDGHNGGPALYYPGAVVVMRV